MVKILPLKDALLQAMDVAKTSIEAADYLHDQFKALLKDAKIGDQSEVLHSVKSFADLVRFTLSANSQPWFGEAVQATDFKNLQAGFANNAIKQLENFTDNSVSNVKLDMAISDDSSLLRGYTADGKEMPSQAVDAFDKLFSAFLAEEHIISQGGILYEVNSEGKIKQDAQGKEVRADAQRVKTLVEDKQKGFASYLDKKGLKITIQQHPYPAPQSVAEKQEAVKEAIKAVTDMKENIAPEPSVESTEQVEPQQSHSSAN